MLALPPSGRRVPPPPRTLLLGLRSYRLMRQSRVALLYFGFWPRSRSLCRLLPAPAATGILPTLFLRILPQMPEPIPRRFAECICLVLPQHSSAFPIIRLGQLPASFREHDFPRVGFRGCSYFIMFRPPSLLASQIVPTAASSPAGQPRLFTSEQNVRRYLRTHRTCYPPDNRQLAERELSSRKIRSLVGCYRMMPTFPPSPLSFRTAGFPQYGWKAGISDKASKRGRPLRTVGPFSSDQRRDRILPLSRSRASSAAALSVRSLSIA